MQLFHNGKLLADDVKLHDIAGGAASTRVDTVVLKLRIHPHGRSALCRWRTAKFVAL